MIVALLLAVAGLPSDPGSGKGAQQSAACKGSTADDVVVCGTKNDRYRIDPAVLQTIRARDALPAKPPLKADAAPTGGCVGHEECKGGTVPLVGVALAAVKAVVLAAEGDDWRKVLRTHEDEYALYKEAQAREAMRRRVRVAVGAVGR